MRAMTFGGLLAILLIPLLAFAGPYEQEGIHKDDPSFAGWATGYENYLPGDDVYSSWDDPEKALGPAVGNNSSVVSLGERAAGSPDPPGEITLTFDVVIQNLPGPDLVVFENGFLSVDGPFLELAYVEVSSDGETFERFDCVSLTGGPVGAYGTLDPTDLYNLAGRHLNNYGTTEGTPFDLEDLTGKESVTSGLLDLDNITHVRIVDIPGSGDYLDTASHFPEYAEDHPIYDAHPTHDSGGFDLDAVGVYVMGSGTDDDDDDDASTGDDDDSVTEDDDDLIPDDDDDEAGTNDDDDASSTESGQGDDDDDDSGCSG